MKLPEDKEYLAFLIQKQTSPAELAKTFKFSKQECLACVIMLKNFQSDAGHAYISLMEPRIIKDLLDVAGLAPATEQPPSVDVTNSLDL